MRGKYSLLLGLVLASAAFWSGAAQGQLAGNYAPPDPQLPLPLYSNNPGDGGFYTALEFVMFRQTTPLRNQAIALRGFEDVDGSITGTPGTFVGSRTDALNARNVSGPQTYAPGFKIDLGWKFSDESSLTLSFMYLTHANYSAGATLTPPFLQLGPTLAESFLWSPVYAFPNDYAGPAQKVGAGNNFAVYGIWNGASIETLSFSQRTQQWDLTYRVPFYETECYRLSGLVGPRFFWIWEGFRWQATSIDATTGAAASTDSAIYNDDVSNRMYGVHAGCQQEWYLGHGFAAMLTTEAVAYLDIVREKTAYSFEDRFRAPQSKRARTDYTLAPELTAGASIMWYPCEGVQIELGYDLMAFFNTISTPRPVAFNFAAPIPEYQSTFRFFDGLRASIAFVF